MSENKYRKIWIEHFGEIPKDEYGITYEIHHKDRDRSNNDITNLMCVSLKEHFYIHFNAKEYAAAFGIMIRMKCIDDLPIGKKELASLAAKTLPDGKKAFLRPDVRKKNLDSIRERINNGTFHLQSGEIQSRTNKRLVSEGKHNFQTEESRERVRATNRRMLKNGTHPFLDSKMKSEQQLKLVLSGKHHLLSGEIQSRTNRRLVSEGRHVFQLDRICKFCNKIGKGFGFHSKHNEYCESNPDRNKYLLKCHFCGKLSHPSIFIRYHGYMCSKFKGVGECNKSRNFND